MKIAAGMVASQADRVNVRAEKTDTTVANASMRQDLTDPAETKIDMRPSGDRIHEQAYSVEISGSRTKSLSVTGLLGSLKLEETESFSLEHSSSQIDTPAQRRPRPIVVTPMGFDVTDEDVDRILAALPPTGQSVKAIVFETDSRDELGNVCGPPTSVRIEYASAKQAPQEKAISSKIDQALVDAMRGVRLVPEGETGMYTVSAQILEDGGVRVGEARPIAVGRFVRQDVSAMELDSVSYRAKGSVLTEDGRSVSFDVSARQTRSFAEKYSREAVEVLFGKPISLISSSPVKEIEEQKYILDYDPAKSRSVRSLLSMEGGVLALDRDGDGRIGSGHELVGASGDAFEELAAYDEDGNGWIDENDSVFKDLMLWKENADGTATLVSLLDADIGAVFLGSQKTGHDLQNGARQTAASVYLKESGGAGIAEQLEVSR